jgi:hypothetical protein
MPTIIEIERNKSLYETRRIMIRDYKHFKQTYNKSPNPVIKEMCLTEMKNITAIWLKYNWSLSDLEDNKQNNIA